MKNIKVLGTGCANCKTTLKMLEDVAKAQGVEVELEKVEDMAEIVGYGVMSTPGIVLDGKVVHAGGLPSTDQIKEWLSGDSSCCDTASESASNVTGGCCS